MCLSLPIPHNLQVNRPDFAVWLVALLATAFLGVVEGVAVAVFVALGLVIWKASFPRVGE